MERSLTYDCAGLLRWMQGSKIQDYHLHTDFERTHNDSILLSFCKGVPVHLTPVR